MVNEFGIGRPDAIDMKKKEIKQQVKLFGSIIASAKEMAGWFDIHERTIERYLADKNSDFCRIYNKARSETARSLRRVQLDKALDGDNGMLVWLGKQLLEQTDKRENTNIDKQWHELLKDVDEDSLTIDHDDNKLIEE